MRTYSRFLPFALIALLSACGGSRHTMPPLSARHALSTAAPSYASTVLSYSPSQYFQLNETSGPTAFDSSTTAVNGSYIGAVTFGAQGPLLDETSTAISLPGGTSSVGALLPNPSAASGTSYSIETWVYPLPSADYITIWGYSGTHRLLLSKTGRLLSQFAGNFESQRLLTTGQWHDVVFVYNAQTATQSYYIDGTFDNSAALANSYAAFTSSYYLGQYNTSTYYKWNGRMAQHAFFRSALTASQVATLYSAAGYGGSPTATPSPTAIPSPSAPPSATPTPGTYASSVLTDSPTQYFKLNETAGPTAYDSSSSAVSGSYIGAVSFGVTGPLLDEQSTAISLPGGTSSVGVSLPNPNATSGTSYSIATWVYPLPNGTMTIWGYDGTHRLLVESSGILLTQFAGNFESKTALTTGRWHDVVFVYNAQKAQGTYYIDGVADNTASIPNSYAAFTSAYYLGQYNTGTYYKWRGDLAQHAFFRSALTPAQISALYANAGYTGASPTPSPAPAYTDWSTFGDNLARTSYNPNETTLSAANVSSLHFIWSRSLGAAIDAQPVVATNVPINGTPATVLYLGAENGVFDAINADTGQVIWSQQLGTVSTACMDLPGGKFGITGTATFDRNANLVYVADGKDNVHALNMQTGAEAAGWPVSIENQFTQNHIYGALTLNPANGLLYAATGSFCDNSPWNGHITAINTSAASVVAQFFPANPYNGAGIWGMGGAAIDANNDVYIGTGNAVSSPAETSAYGDQLVQLSANLSVLASNTGSVNGDDIDYGATPMLYQPPGCSQMVGIKGKAGVYPIWPTNAIASPALQSLVMAPNTSAGQFIGVTAYSPLSNLVYVGDPAGNASFTHGLIALAPQSDCTLTSAWQQTLGPPETGTPEDNDSPVVANGVVYFADGRNRVLYAFDASSGQMLWNSGTTIGSSVMAPPTVDGRVFIGSWDNNLYAFGL